MSTPHSETHRAYRTALVGPLVDRCTAITTQQRQSTAHVPSRPVRWALDSPSSSHDEVTLHRNSPCFQPEERHDAHFLDLSGDRCWFTASLAHPRRIMAAGGLEVLDIRNRSTSVSPLAEVGQGTERAKLLAVEMDGPDGPIRLRTLIEDEVGRWTEDFKRGRREHDLANPELFAERAWRNITGYGPLTELLDDDDVWEIMVNAPDLIFVKRHHGVSGYHGEAFHDDDHVVRTLTKILDDSTQSHRKLDPTEGLQDAQLDTGARIHIVHSDIGRDGRVP